jgi:uncharacterized membrane protein
MEARAKLLGHAIHQMLIPYPLALLTTGIIFDVIRIFTGNPQWGTIAHWMIAAGIIGGLLAAVFGFLDWRAIPATTRAKRVGKLHGVGNVVMVVLFAAAWLVRRADPGNPTAMSLILELAGGALSLGTAWLGGELVAQHGIGINDAANLNAPSSLSGKAGSQTSR